MEQDKKLKLRIEFSQVLERMILGVIVLFFMSASVSSQAQADVDWKGPSETSGMSFGALGGLGIIDGSIGFAFLGTVSRKILAHGFVPDVNNSVSVEAALGPVFLSNVTATAYSAHLRWDFVKDLNWTVYALGGVGGSVMSNFQGGDRFALAPRFGVGTFFYVTDVIRGRAEISHDLIALGLNFPF